MEKEINQIIESFKSHRELNPIYELDVRKKVHFLLSQEQHLKQTFKRITEKYSLNYIQTEYKSNVHLTYWRGSGQYGLALEPESELGVHDRDDEFSMILPDFYNSENYKEYVSERNSLETLQNQTLSNEEEFQFEEYAYKLHDRLYHSIISYFWQEINGYENGIVSSIIENNSTRTFVLNDYCWSDLSAYEEIETEPTFKKKHFNRDLSLTEIYLRSQLYSFDHTSTIQCYFEKNDEYYELELFKTNYKERSGNISEYEPITNTLNFSKVDFLAARKLFKQLKLKFDELILDGWTGKLK